MEDRLPRKLAAILYADVAGYSRLTGEDEDATHRTLGEYLDLISNTIESNRGHVMHYAGDAVLAKFDAVVDAMSAAVAIQNELKTRNEGVPNERQVQFRIGVNTGDVIEDRGDIYGDGVNVAARLEALAEPSGICISDAVRTAAGKKLDLDYEDMGEQMVKNIEEPVRAYRVMMREKEPATTAPASPALKLPDKPSIAVLPFTNMSGDPEHEYFSDGITEDIITELSRFRELLVIARNSSFTYKSKSVKTQEVAADLGVRYVVEGSVRTAGKRIRITAQLVDAETGHHIWAERYDRELTDVFAVQDEITRTVASTAAGRLRVKAEDRAALKRTEILDAYDYVLRGQGILSDTKDANNRAREAYDKALEMDPTCSRAYAGLAMCQLIDWSNNWGDTLDGPLELGLGCAAKAVALDNADSKAQWLLGHFLQLRGEIDEAMVHLERALTLNPNDADALVVMGMSFTKKEQFDKAIDCYMRAMRLNPYYPAWYLWFLGSTFYGARRYDEGLLILKEAITRQSIPPVGVRGILAATYAQLGQDDEARTVVEEMLADDPDASLNRLHLRSEHLIDGLRKAGLPE